MKQLNFKPWKYRLAYGGELRKSRKNRGRRPLSGKHALHLVFKINKEVLPKGSLRSYSRYFLINAILEKYARRFFVKIEQFSIQGDHIHLLIRTSKRSLYQNFFRVVAGQIAQRFMNKGLAKVTGTLRFWKHRPFTRIVKGYKAYRTVWNYVKLNELEALRVIPYRKERLRGLSSQEWELFFA